MVCEKEGEGVWCVRGRGREGGVWCVRRGECRV